MMEKEMLRVLADTGYMVSGQLMDMMFRIVALHDRKSALRLGYKMGGLLLNQERHAEFRRITFLLLYPTIFNLESDVTSLGSSSDLVLYIIAVFHGFRRFSWDTC